MSIGGNMERLFDGVYFLFLSLFCFGFFCVCLCETMKEQKEVKWGVKSSVQWRIVAYWLQQKTQLLLPII